MNQKTTVILFLVFVIHSLGFAQESMDKGLYIKSAPIRYTDRKNLVIEGMEIGEVKDHCIALYGCNNITIRNCKLGPAVSNLGIYLYGCSDITITNCIIENVASGLIASTCSSYIRFEKNEVKNIVGFSRGGEKSWGQMVQFINVSGVGNSISYNVCENLPGESAPEDIINLNQSNGTSESPIRVFGNRIRGGGPSESGGGINLGDNGGSFQTAEENILVDPGQYGIGISGGNHLIIRNNKIVGKQQPFSNVGITVCNWYSLYGIDCHDVTVANNEINYINKNGEANPLWNGSNCGKINGWETNTLNRELKSSILPTHMLGNAGIDAPTWTPGWPVISQINPDRFTVCANLTGRGISYFVVLPAVASPPTSNQIKEGKDAYDKLLGWNLKGKIHCDFPHTEYVAAVTLLQENKNYTIWFTVENPEYNVLSSPGFIAFTTPGNN